MSKARALELKDKLQKLPKNWPENENRMLIREGVLYIEEDHKLKPRWCFLFNDCFLETKPACEFADSNTRLADPSTPYRFKNYMMLNTCNIEEDPNILQTASHQKHNCTPFLLVGHNLECLQRSKKTEESLIYSTSQNTERALWVTDIHGAICSIYTSINNDLMNYGWQNQYRRGNLFHAVYTLNNDLVRQLLSDAKEALKMKQSDDSKETVPPFQLNESLKDIAGHNLLHLAVAVNNVDFIEDHGMKFNVDDLDNNGWSALRICIDNDNSEAMRVLMDDLRPDLDEWFPEDKTVNPKDGSKELDDRSVLHDVCNRGQVEMLTILLLDAQINLEALDKRGNTPLHIAAKKGHEQMVKLLLQHGAPPNSADFKGNRPLHCATTENVARWLVAYGARLKMANHAKRSGEDQWGNKLDKYALGSTLQAADCQVLDAVAENSVWFDDQLSNGCLLCGNTFTVWLRRHHCRSCGTLVCQPCSLRKLQFTKGSKEGKPSVERACDKCFNKYHSGFLRKKNFSWRDRNYCMRPTEFYQMQIMETTKEGSYAAMIREREREKNGLHGDVEDGDEQKGGGGGNEEKVDTGNHGTENGKLVNGKAKKSHVFSKSVGGMFAKHRKQDSDRHSGHHHAQTEAINQANLAISKANERGQKLEELGDKSEKMRDSAAKFNDLAKQLANKKW